MSQATREHKPRLCSASHTIIAGKSSFKMGMRKVIGIHRGNMHREVARSFWGVLPETIGASFSQVANSQPQSI